MKRKILSFVLMLAMAMSVFVLSASANNSNSTFQFTSTSTGLFKMAVTEGRLKEDTSPVYVQGNTGVSTFRVSARGSNYKTTGYVNCTYSAGGTRLSYVTCYKGNGYAIHSSIYEAGYKYAAPFMAAAGSESGIWSPDSVESWPEAIY